MAKRIKRDDDMYKESLSWMSRNYAMGRHSYAASHCEDIMTYSNEVLSPERKEFMALDILNDAALDYPLRKRRILNLMRKDYYTDDDPWCLDKND